MRLRGKSKKYLYNTELEQWADWGHHLCKLKISAEYAHEYLNKMSRNMTPSERVELASITSKYDTLYYKQWEKLIKKIRGLRTNEGNYNL